MKKIMNFRLFLTLVISVIASTLLATFVFISQNSKVIISTIIALAIIVFIVLSFIFKRKIFYIIFAVLFFCLCPFVRLYLYEFNLNKNSIKNVENYCFYGKIYNKTIKIENNVSYIYLDEVKIVDGEKEEDFFGNIYVVINIKNTDTSKIKVGSSFYGYGKLQPISLAKNTKSSLSFLSDNITAKSYLQSYRYEIVDVAESMTLSQNIKNYIYGKIDSSNTQYEDVAYAMLFGDKSYLDVETYSIFQQTGIAHLFAISGLHISLLIFLFSFVLDKLKTNKFAKLVMIFLILAFYVYLCNFAISAIRASIMSLLFIYSRARSKEYDGLSSVSFVLLLFLLINPLWLYDLSLVLSFTAVYSIFLIGPPIKRLLSKILYDKIASTIATIFAVQVGLFAVQLYYFGYVPLLSFISNFVSVPIAGVAYIYVFVAVLISLVIPPALPIIKIFGIIISIIVKFNTFIIKYFPILRFSNISPILFLMIYLLMFVLSDYFLLKKRYKLVVVSLIIITSSCLLLI